MSDGAVIRSHGVGPGDDLAAGDSCVRDDVSRASNLRILVVDDFDRLVAMAGVARGIGSGPGNDRGAFRIGSVERQGIAAETGDSYAWAIIAGGGRADVDDGIASA